MRPKFLIEARPRGDYNYEHLNQIFTAKDKEDLETSIKILHDHYYMIYNVFRRNAKGHFILYDIDVY